MIQKNVMASARLNVTITPEAMKKAKDQAEKENRSLSNMIDTMIKKYKEWIKYKKITSLEEGKF